MPNGQMHRIEIIKALNEQAENLSNGPQGWPNYTIAEIEAIFNNTRDALVQRANIDMDAVATEVLTANNYALVDRKIQAIKEVRTRTSAGLKEAKDAVENVLPHVLAVRIAKLHRELDSANERVSTTKRRYVYAGDRGQNASVTTLNGQQVYPDPMPEWERDLIGNGGPF